MNMDLATSENLPKAAYRGEDIMIIKLPDSVEPDYDSRYLSNEQRVRLNKIAGLGMMARRIRDPTQYAIDGIVDNEILHEWDPADVLAVALARGCRIELRRACEGGQVIAAKANGVMLGREQIRQVLPPEDIGGYKNVSRETYLAQTVQSILSYIGREPGEFGISDVLDTVKLAEEACLEVADRVGLAMLPEEIARLEELRKIG